MLAALILQLVGCPAEVIARDYTLSRLGVEPVREPFVKMLVGDSSTGTKDPMMARRLVAVSSVHYETMIEFLKILTAKYENGARGYVKSILGFKDQDIEKIVVNLKTVDMN